MASAFVVHTRVAGPCRLLPADCTRGSADPEAELSTPALLLTRCPKPGLPPRLALEMLAPAWLPSSLGPDRDEVSMPLRCSETFDRARSAGMLSGRAGIGLVNILTTWASEAVLFKTFRCSAFMRLIWHGETQVVENSRAQSSAGNLSSQILLTRNCCRNFLAFSCFAFRSIFSAFIRVNLCAATQATDAVLMGVNDFRNLGELLPGE
mmetsp:Transcript_12924/g.40319  ORF Transcript_12924/g.40319 Transcript_12924/m.40319 type:complete len:208 (-) Transcript_12924:932-1555(-)